MASFRNYYRAIYLTFGYPLTERMGLSPKALADAESILGRRIPTALRDYSLVAGRERRFNTPHNRLLQPVEWEVDQRRVIFMQENQSVCWWGVSTQNPDSHDPPVSRGFNDEPISWHPEHRKCSVFLAVMLHYQAVQGGFDFTGQADVPGDPSERFASGGWACYGEVASLKAWSRPNQVVCVQPPSGGLPFQQWSILAGGKTQRDLDGIAAELEMGFDS